MSDCPNCRGADLDAEGFCVVCGHAREDALMPRQAEPPPEPRVVDEYSPAEVDG